MLPVRHAPVASVGFFLLSSFRKGLERTQASAGPRFTTFSCRHRLPLLASAQSLDLLVQALRQIRSEYSFKLVGYVVTPEHGLLLVSELARRPSLERSHPAKRSRRASPNAIRPY